MLTALEKRWKIAEPLPPEISDRLADYKPLERQILYNRGCLDAEAAQRFLDASDEIHDPFLLSDMEKAIGIILRAIDDNRIIAVYGDYDVDGVTATALMVELIAALGGEVRAYIPNRFDEGYGLNSDAIQLLFDEGVSLIITVDCGIRSPQEAIFARQLGVELIISDHHLPHEPIPQADAVICPKKPGDPYPDKALAGVGLAYKMASALLQRRPHENLQADDWLDLVALGTVADVASLLGENRSLVREGLRRLRSGSRPGVYSLAQIARVNLPAISTGGIGFNLAPRLNAAGRLESALEAYHLLTERDPVVIGKLAQRLDDKNQERQRQTVEMQNTAVAQISQTGLEPIIFSFHPEYNAGVVGLVAGKLTESFYRPSIVGTIGEDFTRASCRSIPEFHIPRALDDCADLLERHGGHALAAGFTVRNEQLEELKYRLGVLAQQQLNELDLRPVLTADAVVSLARIQPAELLAFFERMQPTGQDNPEVKLVSRGIRASRIRKVGNEGLHLKLAVTDGPITYDAIAFRQGHWFEKMPDEIDILYHLETNYYNGVESLQLRIEDMKPSEM